MNVLEHDNLPKFLACFPKIKNNLDAWRLITISLEQDAPINIFTVTRVLWERFKTTEGDIFICNSREILALARVGEDDNAINLENKIQALFPDQECTAEVNYATKEGLQKIELRLVQAHAKGGGMIPSIMPASPGSLMLKERQKRNANIILVADDDMFIRTLVKKALDPYGDVMILSDGANVVDMYLRILPDIVFLDVHLPVRAGFEILNEIVMFDPSAYVIMISADRIKDNVIHTRELGAKGFLAKPFTKDKLEEALWKCPTITQVKQVANKKRENHKPGMITTSSGAAS